LVFKVQAILPGPAIPVAKADAKVADPDVAPLLDPEPTPDEAAEPVTANGTPLNAPGQEGAERMDMFQMPPMDAGGALAYPSDGGVPSGGLPHNPASSPRPTVLGTSLPLGWTNRLASVGAPGAIGAVAWLLWLARRKLWVAWRLFSHVDREDALSHPVRQELLQIIGERPGASMRDLILATGKSENNIAYHLSILQKHSLIERSLVERRHHFFPPESRMTHQLALLQNDRRRAIIEFVLANPHCTQKEISSALGIPPSRVHAHLGKLAGAGLIGKNSSGPVRTLQASHTFAVLAPSLQADHGLASGHPPEGVAN
jgi:DNA-binding transcriptional ArsR family regulator